MATIIRKQPFFDHKSMVSFHGQSVWVKADQIIVWVSIGEANWEELAPQAPCIPSILDIGTNHEFVVHERLLTQWAGVHAQQLPPGRKTKLRGHELPQYGAHVWLHPYQREAYSNPPPFRFRLDPGIATIPIDREKDFPVQLPLLGLRALRRAKLHVTIDCARQQLTIRTQRRFSLFG